MKVFLLFFVFVGAPHNAKCVRSQVHLNSSEFNVFKISVNTSINFSSKALRTAINFAESCNLNVNFKFEEGGKYVFTLFYITFILDCWFILDL